jgi:hypothetical protein
MERLEVIRYELLGGTAAWVRGYLLEVIGEEDIEH